MTTTARFHLSAALSVTTGRLLCDLDDLYKIVSHIIGRPAYTHDLAFFRGMCTHVILAQHPTLPSSVPEGFPNKNMPVAFSVREFVDGAIRDFGSPEIDIVPPGGSVSGPLSTLDAIMRETP